MEKNILIPVLTVLFYLTSMLGGSTPALPDQLTIPPADFTDISVVGQQGEVIGDRITIRTGSGTDHTPITSLNQGDKVIVLDYDSGWYQVQLNDGRTGWVADYLIEIRPITDKQLDHDKMILGYYLLGTQSYDSLIKNSNSLTSVAPWSWGLNSYGNLVADFDSSRLAEVLQFSGNQQLETYALIHNMINDTFDNKIVSRLLNNPQAQKQAITEIHNALSNWGMTGINLDLENVPAADRQALTEFVAELSSTLRADGFKVTMAVPAKTSDNPNNNFSGAYDYAELGKHVDQLMIMAYDQHYTGGHPGPVASVEWVEKVVQYATSQIPANKVVLGIPNYGYDWPKSGVGKGVTYNQTMDLAATHGVSIRWESKDKVPYFSYGNGNEVWFENRYSIKYKLDLVNKYDLGGIALWRLGQEDPGIWQVINDTLK